MKHNEEETYQLKKWKGIFGGNYFQRNRFEEWKMKPGVDAFRQMIGNINIQSVMEVGSGIGLNLIFINDLKDGMIDLYAIEPNKEAYAILTSQDKLNLKDARNCSAFNLPYENESIDLVFTSGVLIHIAPDDLSRATDEIVRVSKKYILCCEYFSHKPESILYRGETGLLFKRDFGSFYLDKYPSLQCISYGFLWQRQYKIFDNLTWWLFKK